MTGGTAEDRMRTSARDLRGTRATGRGLNRALARVTVVGELPAGPVLPAVFPEGIRGDGGVAHLRHGVAYLAVRSGAPVVPVALHGTAALRRPSVGRPPVLVAYGPALRLSAGAASRRTVAAAAAEIHRTLAAHVSATRPHPEEEQS